MIEVRPTSLDVLTDALDTKEIYGDAQCAVERLTADSRQATAGTVFVAVRGVDVDAHRFIPSAIAAGASVIVAETLPEERPEGVTFVKVPDSRAALGRLASRFYGDPSDELTLVGVTGTNGKTTIATLLYHLARLSGQKAGLLSTVANIVDTESIPADHTTPDPILLNAMLRRMVDAGCTFAAMEVSSHAAHQHRIEGLTFAGGIFTNLTRDHLDYHKTVEAYRDAKKSFFDRLPADAFALTNADDRNGAFMVQNTAARRVACYSVRDMADFRVKVIEERLDGMLLEFDGYEVETNFVGNFNASNLAAVYGAGRLLGINAEDLRVMMSQLRPVCGRFEPFRSADGVIGIVDFAHTPDALVNVLDTITELAGENAHVITVCGCGGNRDKGKRPLMARAAAERSHTVILTSDNPRFEDPMDILADMTAGLSAGQLENTIVEPDRHKAIIKAVELANPGDIILLAGKGHETTQTVGEQDFPFSDQDEISRALKNR